jgi:drug/metabolite transporter (DMT)-like permease
MTTASEPLTVSSGAAAGTAGGWVGVAERRPILLVWFGTVMFSIGPVMMAAATVSGPTFVFWRLWMGTAVIATLALARRLRLRRRGRATAPTGLTPTGARWTLLAGLAFAAHQLMFVGALRATSVVDVTLMNTLSPVIVAVLAVSMFGERPGVSFRLWSVLALAGAVVVAISGSSGEHGHPVGVALAAGSVVFYSLFFLWSKRARHDMDTTDFLAGASAVAALVVSGYVVLTGGLDATTVGDLGLCLAVAAGPGLFGHYAITWSLKWVPANIPPVIMLSIPVLGGVLAWLVLGQGVSALKVFGGAITVIGVAGAVRSPAGRELVVDAAEVTEAV